MENQESIVSECFESLVRRAIAEMNADDAAAKTADCALSELGERVVGDSRLSGIEREVLDEYLTQLTPSFRKRRTALFFCPKSKKAW